MRKNIRFIITPGNVVIVARHRTQINLTEHRFGFCVYVSVCVCVSVAVRGQCCNNRTIDKNEIKKYLQFALLWLLSSRARALDCAQQNKNALKCMSIEIPFILCSALELSTPLLSETVTLRERESEMISVGIRIIIFEHKFELHKTKFELHKTKR